MTVGTGSESKKQYGSRVALGLAMIGMVARLIPHPSNFTPVGGTSLFAGSRIRGWRAYLIPLLILAATDPLLSLLHGYPVFTRTTPVIYAAFLLNVLIGRKLLAKVSPARIVSASVLCSTQFFVLSNLGVWALGGWYPPTLAGLTTCFAAALPFLGMTMVGDLAYGAFLFGLDGLTGRVLESARRNSAASTERSLA